ncbi:DUF5906 domain-containing protein [Faunimonas sp. B44]|uniref:DUF5906 domain-containing protein n=1 Tax=Faunimonas sp. B44 TaxID=3461493 RepID=UPI004044F897
MNPVAPRYQRAVCLIGMSGSGKSRVLEVIKGLMPPAAVSNVSPSDWNDKFMPAMMVGKLLNIAGEVSEYKSISGDTFKMIIEGTQITAQFKNQPVFDFYPTAAQWFASNHIPKTRDTSDGFNRRWLFLEFSKQVPLESRIEDFDKVMLANEREAIAAWALEAMPRLIANRGYTIPSSHMTVVDDMANSNNSVRYFLARCPRLRLGQKKHEGMSETSTTGQRLFDEYWSFCIGAAGAQRVSQQKFHNLMKELVGAFKFQQHRNVTENGTTEFVYEYVTFVDPKRS